MMYRALIALLLASLVLGEGLIWGLRSSFAEVETAYRVYHLLQMLLLITTAFVVRPRVMASQPWPMVYGLVVLGLLSSFAGDVINSYLIDWSHIIEPQTLLSAGPFALAHILYIAAFWRIGRAGAQPVPTPLVLLTLLVWPVIAVSLWLVIVDPSAGPLIKWLSLGYAHMVVLMALCSFWPVKAFGPRAWVAMAGGLVFLLSDVFFGAYLTHGQARPLWVSQVVWASYFLAQLLILHVPLIAGPEEEPTA